MLEHPEPVVQSLVKLPVLVESFLFYAPSLTKEMTNLRWWRRLNWAEYGAEFLGTAFLIVAGLSAVVFNLGENSPIEQIIPSKGDRLMLTGLLFAGSASLFAITPPGKLSGAHVNPVVSLAFWIQGKMYFLDVVGYIVAQFLGAILGAVLIVAVWGDYAATVENGATLPQPGYPLWYVFAVEVFTTFLLVLSILIFVSSRRLMCWTPLMTWLLIALIVRLTAPITGTGLNPARSFGPALVSGFWREQWLYFAAPTLGAVLSVVVFRLLYRSKHKVLTGKLFHVPHYRCIYRECKALHYPRQPIEFPVIDE